MHMLHTSGPCPVVPITDFEREEIIHKGQFSIEAIKMHCKSTQITEKLDKEQLIPAKQLIQLLKYVNLLSPIIHTEADGRERTTYLMPAILECASLEELTTPPPPDVNIPEPLLIIFDCGYVPTGSFCGLITRLVSAGPHRILGLTWELVEEGVKRNFVTFHVDYANKVILICHDKCYELRVERRNDDITLHDLCTYVLSVILYTLKNLYENLIPQIAFQCPCPKHSTCKRIDGLCMLVDKRTSIKVFCERCPVTLKDTQEVWIGKVCS